ncbi:MAG: Beta-ketoadipate enol-lactone hydrolase, partial [uncultured Gemmatimonadaceae bacterium]
STPSSWRSAAPWPPRSPAPASRSSPTPATPCTWNARRPSRRSSPGSWTRPPTP